MIVQWSHMKINKEISEGSLAALVGANIRRRRLAVGLIQQDLAQALGIEVETVSRYERGHIAPPIEQLGRIARVLTTPVWTLFLSAKEDKVSNSLILAEQIQRLGAKDILTITKIITAYADSQTGSE